MPLTGVPSGPLRVPPYSALSLPSLAPADQAAVVASGPQSAAAAARAVYPIGGGTSSTTACRPRPGVRLSPAKLNRVIDYPADDMTITVEAGTDDRPS